MRSYRRSCASYRLPDHVWPFVSAFFVSVATMTLLYFVVMVSVPLEYENVRVLVVHTL